MSRSLSEVRALCFRAALGAGATAGLAEIFGSLAAVHLLAGRRAEVLEDALFALPGGPILDLAVLHAQAVTQGATPVAVPPGMEGDLVYSFAESRNVRCDVDAVAKTVTYWPNDLSAPSAGRVSGYDDFFEHLNNLSAKTLVPDTDASRDKGAGAGEIDNE